VWCGVGVAYNITSSIINNDNKQVTETRRAHTHARTMAAMAAAPAATTTALAAAATTAPAPKSSILGRGLSKEQRVCLLGLVALSLPPEDQALGRWNVLVLTTVARLLRLEDGHWMALQPLLYSEGNDQAIRQVQLKAFQRPFFPEGQEEEEQGQEQGQGQDKEACHTLRLAILRDLLVHLACAALYDARSRRVLMAMAADAFEVDWREMARVSSA
jgi:hypothetical protein